MRDDMKKLTKGLIAFAIILLLAFIVVAYQTPYDNWHFRGKYNLTGAKVISSDSFISNSTTTGTAVATLFRVNASNQLNASGLIASDVVIGDGTEYFTAYSNGTTNIFDTKGYPLAITNLTGIGNDYLCVSSTGKLYRHNTTCS